MSNLHRIAWIDAQVRAERFPNASSIASRFEISRRQAARDIEYLRHSMGAPLEFSSEHNGYTYSDDSFALPAVIVSEAERSALAYLAERYTAIEGESAARVAGVLRRLAGRSIADPGAADRLPVAGLDTRELRALDVVRDAIEQRRKIAVRYRGTDGIVISVTMAPYAVLTRAGALTCIAYRHDVGLTHSFPLARFESVERLEETFEIPALFDLDEWRDDRQPLPQEPFVAIVRLDDPSDAERLESAVVTDAGAYRLEFWDSNSILSALLACTGGFEILEPKWLRARLHRRLDALLRAHAPR